MLLTSLDVVFKKLFVFNDYEQFHYPDLVKAFIANIWRVPNGAFDVHVESCNGRHVPLFTGT